MSRHTQISIAADLPIFFCDPASPWQRGSNENTNGLLRQYFPKGTDLSTHDAEHLPQSPPNSTADPAKPCTGPPPPKHSTHYSQTLKITPLRRPHESAHRTYTSPALQAW